MILVFSEPWFEEYAESHRFRVISGPVQRADDFYEFEVEEIDEGSEGNNNPD